jgi:hypothetical protein
MTSMVKSGILIICVTLLSFFGFRAAAQDVELGVFGGGSYYLGELNPGKQFLFTNPAFGFAGRYNLDKRWSVKLNVIEGKLSGDDAISLADSMRNLRFTSTLTEISALIEFNFFDYFIGSQRNYFTPYLFVGPGFFLFNPKAPFDGEMVALANLRTENQTKKYNLFGLAATFGFGFKYSINSRIGLNLDWGMRKTYTDYIDDISTNYYVDFDSSATPTTAEMLSDPSPIKHKPGMQRGNPENNDWYAVAGLSIIYRFTIGEKSTCTDFEYSKNK